MDIGLENLSLGVSEASQERRTAESKQTVVSGYLGTRGLNVRRFLERQLGVYYTPFDAGWDVPPPPPFPRVRLSQFCPDALTASNRAKFQDGWFTLIGTWNEDPWTISLAIASPSPNPFYQAKEEREHTSAFRLFAVYNASKSPDYRVQNAVADITIFMDNRAHNSSETNTKLSKPKAVPLEEIRGCTFDSLENCIVIALSLSPFRGALSRHARNNPNNGDDVWINTTIDWNFMPSHTLDLSGIGPILLIADILNTVADYLNLLDVQQLRRTCKMIWRLLEDLPGSRTRRALEPYFPGAVSAFADCLDQTGAVVGGSVALHVLCPDPAVWAPSDLDLVCSYQHCTHLVDFILSQGYVLGDERDHAADLDQQHDGYSERSAPGGRFNWKQFRRGPQKIDVSICVPMQDRMTPANFILAYHSSVVMQFITPRGIFCYFPSLTFNGHFLRNEQRESPQSRTAIEKYIKRGYVEMETVAYLQDLYVHEEGWLRAEDIPGIWFQKITLDTSTMGSVEMGKHAN